MLEEKITCRILEKDAVKNYLSRIADIHYSAYSKDHFTSCFDPNHLGVYYGCLMRHADLNLIAVRGEGLVGFIIAGPHVGRGVNEFVSGNKGYLYKVFLLYPKFLIEKICASIISKIYNNKKNVAEFRLMSISVDSRVHSHGVGKEMLRNFEEILINRNITSYGLSVRKENLGAIKFYKKNGMIIEKDTKHALYFRKELKNV